VGKELYFLKQIGMSEGRHQDSLAGGTSNLLIVTPFFDSLLTEQYFSTGSEKMDSNSIGCRLPGNPARTGKSMVMIFLLERSE
jgi:hypothetical protein